MVKTEKPEETEEELKKIVPKELWKRVNTVLVAFGQTVCKPIKPLCSECPVEKFCQKVGVGKVAFAGSISQTKKL